MGAAQAGDDGKYSHQQQASRHENVSERDSLRVLAVLENPPKPNAKLLAAAKSLPKRK